MFQPLLVRPLSASEKEALERCSKSSNKEESWRAEAILLSAEGKTAPEISEEMGYHPSNIKKWIRAFNKKGVKGIAPKKRGPHGGPRPKFTRKQTAEILKLYETAPAGLGYSFKKWSPQKLAIAAEERGIVESISHVTVRQMLKKYKASTSHSDNSSRSTASLSEKRETFVSSTNSFQAGREALARSKYESAVEHFYKALSIEANSPEEEAITRSYLSQALEELSKYEEAYQAVKIYEEPRILSRLSPLTRARLKLRLGLAQSYLTNYPEAIASLNEAKILFLELQDELGISEAQYALGRTYIEINEFRIARDHLLAAASVQKVTLNRELLARIYARLGTVDFYDGAFSSSKSNYLKALELAKGSSNTDLLGMILVNLGSVIYQNRREREESAEYLHRAITYLEKGEHKDYLASAYNILGDNLRHSGLWDEAIGYLGKSIGIAQQLQDTRVEITARITLGEILCAKGSFSDAEIHINKCIKLIEDNTDKWLESNALRTLAIVYRGKGQGDRALKTLRNALRLSTSIGDLHGVTLAHFQLAEFHFLQGGYDQAREYLELAQGRLKEEKSLFISGLVQRLAGQLQASNNRFAEAKQLIAQSISIFTTIEIPFEEARSHYEMGLLLGEAGEDKGAKDHLIKAKKIFENLGSHPDFDLASKHLEAISLGEKREHQTLRVFPANDMLLMQRLIEASASRELLLQELAAVISDNFPVEGILIFRQDEGGQAESLVARGINGDEAQQLCQSINSSMPDSIRKSDSIYFIRIGETFGSPIIIYIKVTSEIDLGRLQPLLKQVELGLETCSLRAAASGTVGATPEHRIQSIIPGFIICSKPMFGVIEKIQKIRTSSVTVLITGESGTGKELVARAIHAESARARAIFLPFNCTATPKEIIDSQLFGHRRGAFTGATTNYPGIIKAADGGTLFLDEIGDLSLEVQPKLMRFLQESEIQPLGETRPLRVDVRVLAATNTDLERAVDDGRFREDLFHRLNIIRIHVPPLRERGEEVPILAGHFLEHCSSRSGKNGIAMTQEALDLLADYDWPGNVRQLRNEIERVVAYASEGARISLGDLSPEIAHPRKQSMSSRPINPGNNGYAHNGKRPMRASSNGLRGQDAYEEGEPVKLKEATAALERRLIEDSLIRNKNNLSQTASELGLSRRGLRLKISNLGIEKEALL